MNKRREQDLFEQFVTQTSIEALDEAVLHRFAKRYITPCDTLLLRTTEDRITSVPLSLITIFGFPSYRFDRRIRVRVSELEAVIEGSKTGGAA